MDVDRSMSCARAVGTGAVGPVVVDVSAVAGVDAAASDVVDGFI